MSEMKEKIRRLYWDSYRSWVDKLEENYPRIRLFQGHPRGVPKGVCNFPGHGMLPADNSAIVRGIGAQVIASEGHIADIVKLNGGAMMLVGDKSCAEMHLNLSMLSMSEDERESGDHDLVEIPKGVIEMHDKGVAIPPRQMFALDLAFDGPAESLLRRIETRVGPGAGWVQIIAYLVLDTTRVLR